MPQQPGKKENAMGIVRTVIASALHLAGAAQAQQQDQASPYSLGLSAGRAPMGLNVSVVGRAQVSSFAAFGKLGTTTTPARPDTSLMGMSAAAMPLQDPASGLSWGGGVSWD